MNCGRVCQRIDRADDGATHVRAQQGFAVSRDQGVRRGSTFRELGLYHLEPWLMWLVDAFVVVVVDQLHAEDLPVVHLLRDKVFVAPMWIRMPDDVRIEQRSLLLAPIFQRHRLYVGDVPVVDGDEPERF
jgi:hypothetical protein